MRICNKLPVTGFIPQNLKGNHFGQHSRWEIASYLYGACKQVSEFLELPSRQCSASRILVYLRRFLSLPPKRVPVFQVPPVVRSIGLVNSTRLLVACGMGLLVDGRKRIWMCARRAAKGGCGSSMARGSSETCSLKSSRNGMSTRVPKRWCCAACGPCRGSGDCRCGSRQRISIPSVSHVWVHKESITNCMEPCGILESIHQVRAPPAQWAELEVSLRAAVRDSEVLLADDREANKAWCLDRKELFLYLTSQLLQDRHTWTFRPGLQEIDVCAFLLTKSILGLLNWIRAGYKGVGDVRPACLFPLVKSKCFLDSGVRRCCKAGHSCMRRVIDCSSVPHKMAWRSVARAIRTMARLGGTWVRNF